MNFDKSIEKLKEPQEKLDRIVEETQAMPQDNERRFRESDSGYGETAWLMGQVLETITKLSQKAQAHDHRLDNLEDRPH